MDAPAQATPIARFELMPLRPEDAEDLHYQITELAREEFVRNGKKFDSSVVTTTPDDYRRWLELPENERPFHGRKAVDEDGRMVGYAIYSDYNFGTWKGNFDNSTELRRGYRRTVHLDDLRVSPEFRGRGIGTLLFSEAAKLAVEKVVHLSLEVDTKNDSAIRLYRRLGGIVTGTKKTKLRTTLEMAFGHEALSRLTTGK